MGTKVSKNKDGYGYKYTDLAQIHDYLESINARYIQKTERIEGDDYVLTKRCFNDKWEDEWLQGSRVVDAVLNGIKNPAQEQGSALTYARRYSLLMAFGLATEDDDDAQILTIPTITTKEEAEACKINFGKYKGLTLGEVVEKDEKYLHWIIESDASYINDNLRKACELLVEPITDESIKQQVDRNKIFLTFQELQVDTSTDSEEICKHYGVSDVTKLSIEQLKESIEIMKRKINNG